MSFRVRGDSTAPKGCAICGRPLAEHRIGEWCRPGFDPLPPQDAPATKDTRGRTRMAKKRSKPQADHTRWLKEVSVAIGADDPRPCVHCGGSGTTTEHLRIGDVAPALLPVNYALSASTLAKRLDNPSLADLECIQMVTGADALDEAASWSRSVAEKIREALAE